MPIHSPAVHEPHFAAPASEPLKLGPTEVQIESYSPSCFTPVQNQAYSVEKDRPVYDKKPAWVFAQSFAAIEICRSYEPEHELGGNMGKWGGRNMGTDGWSAPGLFPQFIPRFALRKQREGPGTHCLGSAS